MELVSAVVESPTLPIKVVGALTLLAAVLAFNVSRLRINRAKENELHRGRRAHGNLAEHGAVQVALVAFCVVGFGAQWTAPPVVAYVLAAAVFFRLLHTAGILWDVPVFSFVSRVIGIGAVAASWIVLGLQLAQLPGALSSLPVLSSLLLVVLALVANSAVGFFRLRTGQDGVKIASVNDTLKRFVRAQTNTEQFLPLLLVLNLLAFLTPSRHWLLDVLLAVAAVGRVAQWVGLGVISKQPNVFRVGGMASQLTALALTSVYLAVHGGVAAPLTLVLPIIVLIVMFFVLTVLVIGARTSGFSEENDPKQVFLRRHAAHANTAEWLPFLASIALIVGAKLPAGHFATYVIWLFSAGRVSIAVGLLFFDYNRPNTPRKVGAMITYLCGLVLGVLLMLQ